jgi:hypothetical protein
MKKINRNYNFTDTDFTDGLQIQCLRDFRPQVFDRPLGKLIAFLITFESTFVENVIMPKKIKCKKCKNIRIKTISDSSSLK